MPKILFLVFLLLHSLSGLAQEESESTTSGKVIVRETPPAEEVSVEEVGAEEDADLAELNALREKQLEKAKMLERATDPLKKPLGNPAEQLKNLTQGQISAAMLLDDKIQAALSRVFSEGHMGRASREETVRLLNDRVKGSFLEKIFQWFPSLLQISVDVVRDQAAVPGLIKILGRKDDLKTFGYIWLAIFIFGLLIKSRLIKPRWPFFKRWGYGLCISVPSNIVTIYIFHSMFSQELKPVLSIIASHWF